jgi:hypothetical protein
MPKFTSSISAPASGSPAAKASPTPSSSALTSCSIGPSDADSDRRSDHRAPLDVFANRFHEGYPYLCRVTDISRKGMRVYRFSEPHRFDTRSIGLQFELPGCPDVLTASGQVVFEDSDSGALGIRFLHLSKPVSAAIESYLGDARPR